MSRSRRVSPEQLQALLLDAPHPRTPQWRQLAHETSRISSWADFFGASRPVEIEVGFGKGLFLLEQGRSRPETNFLGIEIERKWVMFAAARLVRAGLANVRLVCTDARWFLQASVRDRSVQAVHVYFPDPWWKQRHRKRKLLTAEFAAECARVLVPGGLLHFATDVQAYFEETVNMLAEQRLLTPAPDATLGSEQGITHFERKYRQEGRTIYRMSWSG
jgi:tRNA (guanine-N7-)-methyltransferase